MRPARGTGQGSGAALVVRMDFVARGFDRARSHPSPHQHDVLVGRVVETVPAAARRIDDVAFAGRTLARRGVNRTAPLDEDEELVAMPVPLVSGRRDGPVSGP